MPSPLEIYLELAYAAVRYAKLSAPRSMNQRYYKQAPWNIEKEKRRNHFLLALTRCDPRYVRGKLSPATETEAKKVEAILANTRTSRAQKNAEIDKLVEKLGKDYFWQCDRRQGSSREMLRMGLGFGSSDQVEYNLTKSAEHASKFGVGNCDEKSCLTTEYILKFGPQHMRVAQVYLDSNHLGFTGALQRKVTGKDSVGGGDHVFTVIGHKDHLVEDSMTSVTSWGPNAVVVDGWMNDAYPAQHHLAWKYGFNYKGNRVNLAQLHIRNMVCLSYRNNIKVRGSWILQAKENRRAITLHGRGAVASA